MATITYFPAASGSVVSVVAGSEISVNATDPANPVVTNTLATGVSGGQTIIGGTAASDNLDFSSTANATKGLIRFDSSLRYGKTDTSLGLLTSNDLTVFTSGAANYTLIGGNSTFQFGASVGRVRAFSTRVEFAKGANIASAAPLVTGNDGNLYHVTGTTSFAGIVTTNIQAGTQIFLIFDGILTVTHNSGTPGANAAAVFFKSAANLTTAANTTLRLIYDGTLWYEM